MENIPTENVQSLNIGTIVQGNVIYITKSYSIVKVDTVKCVLPISEMTWRYKSRCNVNINDEIEAVVVKIEDGQVMLSTKRLENNPWNNYVIGQVLSRRIKVIQDYGVFVELEPGIDALYHLSEMNLAKGKKLKDIYNIGDSLTLEICMIDTENRKLSMKTPSKEKLVLKTRL